MNQQDPKEIPFTEDPTQKELTSFATFTKSSYTSKFCDHVIDEEGSVYRVEDEKSEDPEVQKANKLLVVEEKRGQGEGLIERKDLYTFCRGFLENEGKNFLRGYWAVGTEDTSAETTSPLPVLQFGTLGLEIHPEKKGIIKLGTWDAEIILKTCILYEEGKNVMKKLSGKGISDEQIRFRWCLRGPTIDPGTHAEPLYKRAMKKVQEGKIGSVVRGIRLGKSKKVEIFADDD